METYKEFLSRINSFEKKELNLGDSDFSVSSGLLKKVDTTNNFTNFYGDTVVFDTDKESKKKVSEIIDILYTETPQCFCEKLRENTIHMTLHDLSNSPALDDVSDECFFNELRLLDTLKKQPVEKQTITMKTNVVFNMVNTSMVLGLYPKDEKEYIKLMKLYNLVDEVKNLPYPLTPHITLAYYNRNGFNKTSAEKLEKVVTEMNKKSFEITLTTDRLFYQKFTDMNNYINIFSFT